MKKLILIIICIVFTCSGAAIAKETDTSQNLSVRNIIYAEVGGFALNANLQYYISFNYERIIEKWLSVRIGYGVSDNGEVDIFPKRRDNNFQGLTSIINFHDIGDRKFNLGVGVSCMNNIITLKAWKITPAVSITYRYQPLSGGYFLSMGFTFAYSGGGVSVGYGHVY